MKRTERTLELAFCKGEFLGIVVGGFLVENGETIDYIKALHARVKELEADKEGWNKLE